MSDDAGATPTSYGDAALIRRLVGTAGPFRPHLLLVSLLTLLGTPLALLQPIPIKIVVDSVLGQEPLTGPLAGWLPREADLLLAASAIGVVAIALLRQTQGLGTWLYSTWIGERLVLRF